MSGLVQAGSGNNHICGGAYQQQPQLCSTDSRLPEAWFKLAAATIFAAHQHRQHMGYCKLEHKQRKSPDSQRRFPLLFAPQISSPRHVHSSSALLAEPVHILLYCGRDHKVVYKCVLGLANPVHSPDSLSFNRGIKERLCQYDMLCLCK